MSELYRYVTRIPGKEQSTPAVDDLHQLSRVIEVRLLYPDGDDAPPSVEVDIACVEDAPVETVTLRMDGIRSLHVGELVPTLWLTETEVEDVRGSELEGVRFRIFTRLDRAIDCLCSDFTIYGITSTT